MEREKRFLRLKKRCLLKRKTYSENQPKSFGPENLIEVNPDSWRESDWRGFFMMISDAQKRGIGIAP